VTIARPHVARVGDMKNTYKILVGKPEEKIPPGRLGVDGKMILKYILET